jgi:MFS superfamily sulfate permease-like transporter
MSRKKKRTTINITLPGGFAGALFLIFMTLKLTDHIDWSWWWVSCPLWAGPAIAIAIVVVVVVAGLAALIILGCGWAIMEVLERLDDRRRDRVRQRQVR